MHGENWIVSFAMLSSVFESQDFKEKNSFWAGFFAILSCMRENYSSGTLSDFPHKANIWHAIVYGGNRPLLQPLLNARWLSSRLKVYATPWTTENYPVEAGIIQLYSLSL